MVLFVDTVLNCETGKILRLRFAQDDKRIGVILSEAKDPSSFESRTV
jgi:hypothetical protein